ncbi:hypothetical protein C8J57DRAFT_1440284 [Mycena rebaudengoi]|nr:hypothetical protein C8J57DRAFT_1440284 [Mycena rebaudengoi]
MSCIAEQILRRKNAQENGTCVTLIPLHNVKLEHLFTADLDRSILEARALHINDILLSEEESAFFSKSMVHTILCIIINHGGEGFEKWRPDLAASQPIDESSITGNVEVLEQINKTLGFDVNDPDFAKYVQVVAGDQLTIACQCSILNVRLGHESSTHSWKHVILMPGHFHAKIADCHGVLETHFGKVGAGTRSPGFHNTVLDRLPITLTSLPPFHTCCDLIMVSLYARVLHCLLLVSGADSLDAYSASVSSWDTVVGLATQIYSKYADADHVQELCEWHVPGERKQEADRKASKSATADTTTPLPHICAGDMVYKNTLLFLRDALLTREFADAVKVRDSGCILIILRLWAFCYQGNGRTKYAHKMLHLLHNILCVWTKELHTIILQNWLANPQGKAASFVEIDLVQEHLNYWIKKVYKADGTGHSWEWLVIISPCIGINTKLRAHQGSKHTTPGLENDIDELMDSLDEHEVYAEKEGRVLDNDEKPAPASFEVLCAWRGLTPVADLVGLIDPSGRPHAWHSDPHNVIDPPMPSTSKQTAAPVDTDSDEEEYAGLPELAPAPADEDEDNGDINEDLFAMSPTLTRDEEGDVALDMDVDEWFLDDSNDEYSDVLDSDNRDS